MLPKRQVLENLDRHRLHSTQQGFNIQRVAYLLHLRQAEEITLDHALRAVIRFMNVEAAQLGYLEEERK